MFTGIVERTARVLKARNTGGGCRLSLGVESVRGLPPWKPVVLGESIAVNGVCLSAVEFTNAAGGGEVTFDVVPETLERTTLGSLGAGDAVNVERSLAVGDSFDGHYVTGHIDGTATVSRRRREGDQEIYEISLAKDLLGQVIVKGSIAVDGISLTVVDVERRAGWFSFAAIPHTLERTALGDRRPGDAVNIETDAFGKWVLHGLEQLTRSAAGEGDAHWRRLLKRSGFLAEPEGS